MLPTKKTKKTKKTNKTKKTKKTGVFYKSLCVFFLRLKKNKKSGSAQHGRNQIAAVLPLIRIRRRYFMTTSGLSVPRHWRSSDEIFPAAGERDNICPPHLLLLEDHAYNKLELASERTRLLRNNAIKFGAN